MKYRKKPVVVEAMRLPEENEDPAQELIDWLNDQERVVLSGRNGSLIIQTPEGDMTANPGDWVIKGVKGELYPCKPDVFEATYEVVEDKE